jgi:hypothetical protein
MKLFTSAEPEEAGDVYVYPPGEDHEHGTPVYLAAKKKDGWKFDHWAVYGRFDPVITYDDAIMLPMWEDRAAAAFFTRTWRGAAKEAMREQAEKWGETRQGRIAARVVELMG